MRSIYTKNITLSALFAALIFIAIMFFHVPNGFGGFIHFGDALIFISASILPFPFAIPVAMVGAGMFNLLRGPMWLPFTVVIKPLMTLCFTSKSKKILIKRNIFAPFAAAFINTVLYFGANIILFDIYAAIGAFIPLLIQGAGSIVFYFIIALALDRSGVKKLL